MQPLSNPYPALIQSLPTPHPTLIQPLIQPSSSFPALIQPLSIPYPHLINPLSTPFPPLINPLSTPYPTLIQPHKLLLFWLKDMHWLQVLSRYWSCNHAHILILGAQWWTVKIWFQNRHFFETHISLNKHKIAELGCSLQLSEPETANLSNSVKLPYFVKTHMSSVRNQSSLINCY